jgi:O-antigen ligase
MPAYGLVKTGQLFWLDIPSDGARVTSTFVNHNSFATFAGMALVAITGLVVNLYRQEVIAGGNWRLWLASLIETTGRRGAALLGAGFVILAALLLTGSRGGAISTGLGLLVLGVLASRRGRNRDGRLLVSILLGSVLVAATAYAFGGILFSKLDVNGVSDANRISVYVLTLRSIFDAPLLGYGYGTFIDVFPMYRDKSISVDGIWDQAHDTYLELFQGLGLVFGTMLLASVTLLALRCLAGSLRRRENAFVPAVAASAACLVGVHTLVDFSLQMQAVALIFMAILGAGVAQSESSRLSLED